MQVVLRHLRGFRWPKEVPGNCLVDGRQMENARGVVWLRPGAGVAISGRAQTQFLAFGVRAFACERLNNKTQYCGLCLVIFARPFQCWLRSENTSCKIVISV